MRQTLLSEEKKMDSMDWSNSNSLLNFHEYFSIEANRNEKSYEVFSSRK